MKLHRSGEHSVTSTPELQTNSVRSSSLVVEIQSAYKNMPTFAISRDSFQFIRYIGTAFTNYLMLFTGFGVCISKPPESCPPPLPTSELRRVFWWVLIETWQLQEWDPSLELPSVLTVGVPERNMFLSSWNWLVRMRICSRTTNRTLSKSVLGTLLTSAA